MYSTAEQQNLVTLSKEFLNKEIPIDRIDDLRKSLHYHEWKYAVKNDPIISDSEYDSLFKKLEAIESTHPELITPDSPTQRVTSDLANTFETVDHLTPMLSLGNSYNAEDLKDFDEQIKKLTLTDVDADIEYCVEPKFDGGSIAVVYENDVLIRAATRGNGAQGEDMTLNAKALTTIPLKAAFSKYGIHRAEIRGEALIPIDIFKQVNKRREKEGIAVFANPRNAATGGLRMKDPTESSDRGIEVFMFQLGHAVDKDGNDMLRSIPTHFGQIELLGNLGFKIPTIEKKQTKNIEDATAFIKDWEAKRDDYAYEIDGMVVKVNSVDLQDKCGFTQHHPRWAIAYKFKAKQATSILESVEYQVGKVGSITPVAKIKPVQLAGVTVSSISLHNAEFIKSKDLRLGDHVLVERAGDVIPYIVKSFEELRDGSEQVVEYPQHCPINTTETPIELIKEEGEAAWRCPNCVCGQQTIQKMIFHVSKGAMNIDGLGKSQIERFYELGWIRDNSDIYNLDYEAISKLEGFGEKSATNLENAINSAKKNSIKRLLHSFSIHHVGTKASILLAQNVLSIFDLQNWTKEDFVNIKDIGPVVADNVIAFFNNEENINILRKMESLGVNMLQTDDDRPIQVADDAPFANKTILFTGTLTTLGRKEAQELAAKAGAKNVSSISKKLDILVAGEKAGSKLKKAEAFGTVEIMTEAEFVKLVKE